MGQKCHEGTEMCSFCRRNVGKYENEICNDLRDEKHQISRSATVNDHLTLF